MKKIGLIGGMSWESTIDYYRIINQEISARMGGLKSAPIIMESYDFDEILKHQNNGEWSSLLSIFVKSSFNLINAGAEVIVIAANTMHKFAPRIQSYIGPIPVLHIADTVGKEIVKQNIKTVALIGTNYIVKEDFYINKLVSYGLSVITPEFASQDRIHNLIFDELCKGFITDESKEFLTETIRKYKSYGIEGIVWGCTELPQFLYEMDLPIFSTTTIHALAAADFALQDEKMTVLT